ncbi:hypothetical protein CEP51_000272 [Fusarium floridanum]|uniref:FMN hydroxy acid dehydrogenase domain-containing protein n=1 Tax=Fusarium floridanum TaxID=1325733 RepID=A0A428SNJ3_9HYPO|nr:hypothetical protein CEP51_000272 [Fusarium floridanum]
MPRRLVPGRKDDAGNERFLDTTTTVLSHLPFPVAIAPIATASLGISYILSTASSTSIEDVAAANGAGAPRWYQLYWPSREPDDITISLLKRAKTTGYTALFVTLDTYVLGWRPIDLDNGYNPFIHPDHIGVEIGLTDPVFQNQFKEKHGYDISSGPSAIALGAKCVIIGRPYAYGLALGGEEGVRHVLRAMCGDLTMNMHLAGLRDIHEVTRDILVKESDIV